MVRCSFLVKTFMVTLERSVLLYEAEYPDFSNFGFRSFSVPPVILFSVDGFRADYLYRNLTPNTYKLSKHNG